MARNNDLRRLAELQEALLAREAQRSLRSFVEQAWPILEPDAPFMSNWHIDLLAEYLEEVTAGKINRLVINLPPRCMKSLMVSVLWPVWEWIARPGERWIFTSYSDTLATKHSVDRRTVIQSSWYQRHWGHRVQLASDQNVKGEFQNTRRGVMVATSVGGSITGKGGNRIVVDDPHNTTHAESDAQRVAARTYFSRTLSTRLDDKKRGAIVVVMQRLHEEDLSALCLDSRFTHLCLPAEAETQTTILFPRSGRVATRDPGDPLWPDREGTVELAQQKRMLGSTAYAGQYQQHPAPAGGIIFQRGWWKFYDDYPQMDQLTQSWDMSFKDRKDNDYVVGLVGGRRGADIYIIDRVKGQWSFTESCRQVRLLSHRHPRAHTKLIEDAANGPAIIDALRHDCSGIIPVQPEGGKLSRAQAVQPLVEAGNVYLPNPRRHGSLVPGRSWVDDFIHQLAIFPNGAHDDDVDAFSQLLVRLRKPRFVSVTWR